MYVDKIFSANLILIFIYIYSRDMDNNIHYTYTRRCDKQSRRIACVFVKAQGGRGLGNLERQLGVDEKHGLAIKRLNA